MPILADLVTATTPPILRPVDDRRLEFESLDGTDLISWSGNEWIARSGISGLDIPPREVIRGKVVGLPGSRLQEIRDDERTVFLPLTVRPADRDYRTSLAQLAAVRGFLDYRTVDYGDLDGTFDLVAYSARGRRALRCTYLEGLEGDYGADVMFSSWLIFGLRLLAVDPYWHGQEWSTPTVQLPAPAPFLSNDPGDGFPRKVTASVALGADMPVRVGGDVPSPAVIELTGPASTTHITSPQGLDLTLGSVGGGRSVLIDTGRRRSVLTRTGSGPWAEDWTILGDTPKWRPLPPGEASISVEVTGANENTRARVHGSELWETAW